MKTSPLVLLLFLLAAVLTACTSSAWHKAFAPPSLTLNYDDFGPEHAASKFLGPRGAHTIIIAHYGFNHITPTAPEDVRYVNVLQSMNFLGQQVRSLPPTAANEPLRQRLRATYARKVGSNPGATAQGMDSDGTNTRGQYWLQFSMWF